MRSNSDSESDSESESLDECVEKVEKNIDLIDYLFKFLEESEKDLNYVLVGYFVKILNFLFYKNNDVVIQTFFNFRF